MKTGQYSQLISIVLLFLIVLGAVLFVFPMRDDIEAYKTQETALAAEVANYEAQLSELTALSEQVATSETTKQTLMAAVPDGYSQDELILELSSIAEDLEFTLNAVNFSDTTSEEFGNTVEMTANFSGTYEELIAFLQKLETAERLMRVVSLNVQRTTTTDIAFNVGIEAYYQ